ncbi:hypothetical protein [Geobacter sp. SVR]|uniref:hypothetical protein n=1 Tax=Geobacter sp. SVR TaxID=2495594 RepID=UPI00143EFAF3|nr:hypothetical protein [Geobacter sp. SVR]BCS53975.1 hypothetical protein GSVR_22830 [Geobacter sp. SVR]GCF86244.1 hypothetical protein GSbR_28440 [Geobacter sp. SVR]
MDIKSKVCSAFAVVMLSLTALIALLAGCNGSGGGSPASAAEKKADSQNQMVVDGQKTFRFDTFGDETFWGDTLKLHQAIAGIGPKTVLSLGLKVDVEALPADLTQQIKEGDINLDDPASTIALLKLNAVVGVTGFFNEDGSLRSIGIQCALCHSTVDDSFSGGIGHRLDGWANRDLDIGAIVALAPNLKPLADLLGSDVPTVKAVLNGWGPGKFDAELFLDGKTAKPGGMPGSSAALIPPAFGLSGVNLHTWTGWGSVTYWNAFVANIEMHGKGTFYDPRLNDAVKFPVAARNGFFNVRQPTREEDLITPKLASLHLFQLSLPAPAPPAGSFDAAAADRGKALFSDKAKCATCHVPPLFTEPGWNMHTAAEVGIDDFQAKRSPDERYRTSPLKGLWTHTKGGFYHDGRFATLLDVINHYDSFLTLRLSDGEKNDLVEYLKSL